MKYMFRIFLLILSVGFWTNSAAADPYEQGLEAYKDGEYRKAYKILDKASSRTKDKFDKASMMVLMGASAVKLGKNSKAKNLFIKASNLDPDVQLPSVAMRDRKVKKAFASASESRDEDFASEGDDFGADMDQDRGSRKKNKNKDRDRDRDRDRDSSMDFGSDSKSKSKRRNSSSASGLSLFLPFGVNDMVQGKYIQGALLGAAQGLSLFLGFVYFPAGAAEADADAKAAFETAAAQGALGDPNLVKFLDENETYVNEKRQYATLSLIMFPAFYALSVVDAAYGIFGEAPRSRRNASVNTDRSSYASDEDEEEFREPISQGWHYDFGLLPRDEPSFYFSLKTEF